jgi:hypothetical protein
MLDLAGGEDAGTDFGGTFGGGVAAELFVLDGGDFDVDVDAVEERAADFADVALDHGRSTHAVAGFVVEVAAGLRVISVPNLPAISPYQPIRSTEARFVGLTAAESGGTPVLLPDVSAMGFLGIG